MKLTSIFCMLFLLFGFLLFSCKAPPVEEELDLAQVRKSIEEANLKFGEAFRQGNPAAVADLYTEEAAILPPNSEMIKGKQGIEAFWKAVMEMGVKDAVLTTVDLMVDEELVCEIGEYTLTIQPEGQEPVEDRGKYVVIWKQTEEGTWKLHVDIWNTSLPAK